MQVTAAEFEAKGLKLMGKIARTREPIAKLMPADEQPPSLFGYMKGKGAVTFLGDIVDSSEVEWNAQKDFDSYEDSELYGRLRLLHPPGNKSRAGSLRRHHALCRPRRHCPPAYLATI